jgi:uncharacterized membrane protein YphA (DoxX/SURF4 family)
MERRGKKSYLKKTFIGVGSYLFIFLFLYAAVSKLLDFETFTVQLAQSPLLSAYAGIIAWLVPGIEILIACLLVIERFRTLALYSSFTLMVMFTAYIYIILNFSDFIPCSCGGVLEKLSWTQHLFFNIFFIILAGVAVFLADRYSAKKTLLLLATLAIFGVGTVTLLFAFSEKKMHRNNAFIRRYPHQVAYKTNKKDLKYNSYYFAGMTEDSLYLGNITAPNHFLAINKVTQDTLHRRLHFVDTNFFIRDLKTIITDSIFYTYDGTVPILFKGNTKKLLATERYGNGYQFLRAINMAKDSFAIRVFDNVSTKNVLGRLIVKDSLNSKLFPTLLKANSDPFFDTDGLLLYNQQLQKVIYVYFYRNEFVVANHDFSFEYIGKTIDTISNSQLDVHNITSKHHKKMGKNPIFVNLRAATYGNYLYIQSDRLGKFEPDEVINSAFIIDVYNLMDNTYAFSFYLYHQGENKLNEFLVADNRLFALINNYLIIYKLEEAEFLRDK